MSELADHFLIRCARDCTDPSRWAEAQLTDESFDYALAPVARGLFLGDYVGLSATRDSFDALFPQAVSTDDPSSAFFPAYDERDDHRRAVTWGMMFLLLGERAKPGEIKQPRPSLEHSKEGTIKHFT